MITVNAPLRREDFKRVIVEAIGAVEIREEGMKLLFSTNNEEEDFVKVKSAIKNDAVTKALYSQVTK